MLNIEWKNATSHSKFYWLLQFIFITLISSFFGINATVFLNISIFFAIIILASALLDIYLHFFMIFKKRKYKC